MISTNIVFENASFSRIFIGNINRNDYRAHKNSSSFVITQWKHNDVTKLFMKKLEKDGQVQIFNSKGDKLRNLTITLRVWFVCHNNLCFCCPGFEPRLRQKSNPAVHIVQLNTIFHYNPTIDLIGLKYFY